jgi:hypothetical protein
MALQPRSNLSTLAVFFTDRMNLVPKSYHEADMTKIQACLT